MKATAFALCISLNIIAFPAAFADNAEDQYGATALGAVKKMSLKELNEAQDAARVENAKKEKDYHFQREFRANADSPFYNQDPRNMHINPYNPHVVPPHQHYRPDRAYNPND